jgi:hypothetical protein
MGTTDVMGGRGEAIASARLAASYRAHDLPYFLPHYLGEKCPLFDFFVELVDAGRRTPYFFVQVKATRKAFTKTHDPPRLLVGLSAEDVRGMVAYPAPTYVIEVQEREERAFLISIHGGMRDAISSITTAHELTPGTLRRLWVEVRDFWRTRQMSRTTSLFPNAVVS